MKYALRCENKNATTSTVKHLYQEFQTTPTPVINPHKNALCKMQRAKIRGTTFIIHNHIAYISQFDNVNHSVISYCSFRHPVQKLPSTSLSSDHLSAGEQSSLVSESCVLLFLTTFFFFILKTNDILVFNSDFVKNFQANTQIYACSVSSRHALTDYFSL